MEKTFLTAGQAKKEIEFAISQAGSGGSASTMLNETYPWTTGMTLTICSKPREIEMGGTPVRVAQSQAELMALLKGEEPSKLPNYNIDWDTRNDESGNIVTVKKKDGSRESAMGSIDFDTLDEGAEKLAKAINELVPALCWSSPEEQAKIDAEIQSDFQKFFDKHCGDNGDCGLKGTCEVRWPGGFGLQGCHADGAIREEIKAYL